MSAQEEHVRGDLPEGTRLGPWRLLHLIGRGGAGEVYLAVRADGAFQQKAAIKVLHRGAVAETTRFKVEREILARLEHPGIARLLDGGVHADGRPYMVMEYVEGVSLTEFCDAGSLDLDSRLKLFIEVCDVVALAHRNFVVHRDLKPRNILITQDGRVKLLDFGVAKLLDAVAGPAAEKTSAPLTPDYAAPEQLTGQPITTATDVYALGVVLFELLTSRKPFHNTAMPVAHAVRSVLQEVPPAPSRAARLLESARVPARRLEGDLDAIVAKCLRKEASHRYENVDALELDLRRHRRSEPVSAREGARLTCSVASCVGTGLASRRRPQSCWRWRAPSQRFPGKCIRLPWNAISHAARRRAKRRFAITSRECFALPQRSTVPSPPPPSRCSI
ncbi:MAG: serine/threonine-protein kinase [Gammaproteobacteria bacterium]